MAHVLMVDLCLRGRVGENSLCVKAMGESEQEESGQANQQSAIATRLWLQSGQSCGRKKRLHPCTSSWSFEAKSLFAFQAGEIKAVRQDGADSQTVCDVILAEHSPKKIRARKICVAESFKPHESFPYYSKLLSFRRNLFEHLAASPVSKKIPSE
jgi:hypothetical protein